MSAKYTLHVLCFVSIINLSYTYSVISKDIKDFGTPDMVGCSWLIANTALNFSVMRAKAHCARSRQSDVVVEVTNCMECIGRYVVGSAWDITSCMLVYDEHNNTWLGSYQYSYQHGQLHISIYYPLYFYEALRADTRTDTE